MLQSLNRSESFNKSHKLSVSKWRLIQNTCWVNTSQFNEPFFKTGKTINWWCVSYTLHFIHWIFRSYHIFHFILLISVCVWVKRNIFNPVCMLKIKLNPSKPLLLTWQSLTWLISTNRITCLNTSLGFTYFN